MRPILFLDFDGVLHPVGGDVAPLEYAPVLVQLLAPHSNVHIVLSTSWVGTFGFDNTRAMLPLELQHRVVGATYRSPLERYLHHPGEVALVVWVVGVKALGDEFGVVVVFGEDDSLP